MYLIAGLSAALVAILAALELGLVPITLPFPPGLDAPAMKDPPPGLLPPKHARFSYGGNTDLRNVEYLFTDKVRAVETLAVDSTGRLGFVDTFGKVFLAQPDGSTYALTPEPIAYIPGRSLGVKFDANDDLYICNTPLGLVKIVSPGNPSEQRVELVSARTTADSPVRPGEPADFLNGIDIASDGTLYLSHTTDIPSYKKADGSYDITDSLFQTLARGAPDGMLLSYHTHNRSLRAHLDGLVWGNGLVLAHDGSYVLIGDTWLSKIHRYWITGPKVGTVDIFAENLPCMVDGLSRSSDGGFWGTCPADFPPPADFSQLRLVRILIAYAPSIMRFFGLPIPPEGIVLKLSAEGKVVQVLGDPGGKVVHLLSSALEHDGKLFLGTLNSWGVPVLTLKN